jgi:sirohydrochlorin cobaltochelatase
VSQAPAPLVLVGHGTKDAAGVAAFGAFTRRLGALFAPQGIEVAGGFIELSAPPLREAVAGLAASGHRQLVAVPLVLSAASHAKGDIPAALARESARHPGLSWEYGRPLGPHPVLLELLAERIAARPATAAVPPGGDGLPAVLLVGRGSTDPDANAEVCKTARLLWEGRDYAFVETAFVSLAAPDVAAGLERCRRLGARRIAVASYFLFPGVLPDRIVAQARGYAAAHPELEIACTDVLGDTAELAGLVAERYREALAGDIRMNCDVCAYRIALPGSEHLVGAAARPHAHPHDDGHVHAH